MNHTNLVPFFTSSVFALALATSTTAGCTYAKISGRGSVPLVLNQLPGQVRVVKHIEASKLTVFDYTGTFDASELLADYIASNNGDAVQNVSMSVGSSVGTFFINLFTLGLANAKEFKIQADIVKTNPKSD